MKKLVYLSVASACLAAIVGNSAGAQDDPSLELKGPQSVPKDATPAEVPYSVKPETVAPLRGAQTTSIEPAPNQIPAPGEQALGGPIAGPPQNITEPASLTGVAKVTDLSAHANQLLICPLARNRDENLKFIEVRLKNDSDQAALINGDAVRADFGTATLQPVTSEYMTHTSRPGLGGKGTAEVVLVSGMSLGLAGPIFYEMITPTQHKKRYLGTAIGIDGARHSVEATRFGLRVVMPGDETYGWLAFEAPGEDVPKSISIPISFHKSLTPDGTVVVPVDAPPAPPIEAAPTAPAQKNDGKAPKEQNKKP